MGLAVFVLGQRLQVLGNHLGSAGNSSVLMALEPLLASLAAAVFLRERLGPRRLIGCALGMTGVALLNRVWSPDFQWTGLAASAVFISSFLCETAYSILGKPILARAGGMKVLAVALVAGTAANLILYAPSTLTAAARLPLQGWLWLGYLSWICTVIGYGAWFVVIRQTEVNVAVLTIFAQPVFGVAVAALWLGEPLHWGQLWGTLAIAAGLAFGLSRQLARPGRVAEVPTSLPQATQKPTGPTRPTPGCA